MPRGVILAIDTAGPWVAACAGAETGDRRARRRPARLDHNEVLQGMVDDLLGHFDVGSIIAVAVDVGPGSFTGTRVGVAFAAGLAQGWQVPLLPLSSFEVAVDLAPETAARVAVAVPVVRDQWCRAVMARRDHEWQEETVVELLAAQLGHELAGLPLVVPWGDLPDVIGAPPQWNPAEALWRAARIRPTGCRRAPEDVQVRYSGPSQAERRFRERGA